MYAVANTFALGSGYGLDGSGYRRMDDPQYIKDAREHRRKGRRRTKTGALIVVANPDAAYAVAGGIIGGVIAGPAGAATGTKVGGAVGIGVTLVGVGYLGSGLYHQRKARRITRRGSNRSARRVRRDARRRSK